MCSQHLLPLVNRQILFILCHLQNVYCPYQTIQVESCNTYIHLESWVLSNKKLVKADSLQPSSFIDFFVDMYRHFWVTAFMPK